MDAVDFAKDTRAYILDYIKFGDQKAGAVVTFVTLLGGVVAFASKTYFETLNAANTTWFVTGLTVGAVVIVAGVMALWHAILALAPNTVSGTPSLAGFPDIAAIPEQTYEAAAVNIDTAGIVSSYALHNHVLAGIATAKFAAIRRAITWVRVLALAAFGMILIYSIGQLL